MLREIKVGSSRSEALREMSNRIGMSEVNSFVAILISADQMGAAIGKFFASSPNKFAPNAFSARRRKVRRQRQKFYSRAFYFFSPPYF